MTQMPLSSPFPGNLSILAMDNARIHHGAEILELAKHFCEFSFWLNALIADVDI
jgi:hypothetical protein